MSGYPEYRPILGISAPQPVDIGQLSGLAKICLLDLFTLAFEGPRARALLEKTLHIDIPSMKEFDHFAEEAKRVAD